MKFLCLLGLTWPLCHAAPSANATTPHADKTVLPAAELQCQYPPEPSPGVLKSAEVIDISRDGVTCPEGFAASDPEYTSWSGWACFHGDWVGNRALAGPTDGKCCFSSTQYVFLRSIYTGGAATHQGATYHLDGRTYCVAGDGEAQGGWAAGGGGQCAYRGAAIWIGRPDWVSACCWDTAAGDFSLHLRQPVPLLDCAVQRWLNSTRPSDVCGGALGLGVWVRQALIFTARVDLFVDVAADCRGFRPSGSSRLSVNLDSEVTDAGEIHLPVASTGPTVIATFQAKVNDAGVIELYAHITGTEVLSGLDEWFQQDIDINSLG